MKQSRLEAMRAEALKDQAEKVAALEGSVASLSDQVSQVLATVTEILENLQPKTKGKAKDAPAE
jgi:hypothetical protein